MGKRKRVDNSSSEFDEFAESEFEQDPYEAQDDLEEEYEAADDDVEEPEDDEEVDVENDSRTTNGGPKKRQKRTNARIKKTDDGQNLTIMRVKIEDKRYMMAKQKNVINYVSAVLYARYKFYTQVWRELSDVFVNEQSDISSWSKSSTLSDNIKRWLGTSSIGFCLNYAPTDRKLAIPPIRAVKREPERPHGRPRKPDDQLKRPRRYILKQSEQRSKSVSLSTLNSANNNNAEVNAAENGGASASGSRFATEIQHVPIFEARCFSFTTQESTFGGMESGVRVSDLTAELARPVPTADNFNGDAHAQLSKEFFAALKQRTVHKTTNFQALFCGGPISAMAAAPRRTSAAEEVIAISTFADEKLLSPLDNCSHVQLWTYPSDLSASAMLKLILEVPDASQLLSLCWCSAVTDEFFTAATPSTPAKKRPGRPSSAMQKAQISDVAAENFRRLKNVLGFLAVGTNNGRILIYCIPRNLDVFAASDSDLTERTSSHASCSTLGPRRRGPASKKRNASANNFTTEPMPTNAMNDNVNRIPAPPIFRMTPKFVLQHPVLSTRIDEGTSQSSIFFRKAPKKGRCVAELSASIAQYNDTMRNTAVVRELNDFPILQIAWSPFCGAKQIAAVSASGRVIVWNIEALDSKIPPLIVYAPTWTTPISSVSWLSANQLSLAFRTRCQRIYNLDTESCSFVEDTTKSAGQFSHTVPAIFPGLLTYDTAMISIFDVFVAGSTYISFNNSGNLQKALVVPLFNNHQIHLSRMSVCEMSGCVLTVGFDGRMHASLCGRLVPHEALPGQRKAFSMARNILQLVTRSLAHEPPLQTLSMCTPAVETTTTTNEVSSTSTSKVRRKRDRKPAQQPKTLADALQIDAGSSATEGDLESGSIARNMVKIKREYDDGDSGVDEESSSDPLCFAHSDCCAKKWLEIRVGDAAMKDQVTMRRMLNKLPEVLLDRRLEALSFVESSRMTPGLTICGGEAGLVFITQCIL